MTNMTVKRSKRNRERIRELEKWNKNLAADFVTQDETNVKIMKRVLDLKAIVENLQTMYVELILSLNDEDDETEELLTQEDFMKLAQTHFKDQWTMTQEPNMKAACKEFRDWLESTFDNVILPWDNKDTSHFDAFAIVKEELDNSYIVDIIDFCSSSSAPGILERHFHWHIDKFDCSLAVSKDTGLLVRDE